ncbi:MAG: YhbY family RNA-binding protein [bacterium]
MHAHPAADRKILGYGIVSESKWKEQVVLNNKTKSYLKRLANPLKPVVFIGKNGVTDHVNKKTETTLASHELIKIKFVDFKDEKGVLSAEIAGRTGSEVVGMVGHVAVLYREHPEEEKRRIRLPDG